MSMQKLYLNEQLRHKYGEYIIAHANPVISDYDVCDVDDDDYDNDDDVNDNDDVITCVNDDNAHRLNSSDNRISYEHETCDMAVIRQLSSNKKQAASKSVHWDVDPVQAIAYGPIPFTPYKSPRRYVETDVNIHYKTPVRFEYKDPVPEAELAYRQAEHMKKLYQEERRRKYLQELQDMSNRRHTDYFTPSQKSPIALNRYDDFATDLSPVSPPSVRTVARALYNFQGQSARELSFRKGDIIYIRREIDKNWYEGEHNAMVGLLPSNYVEIISTRDGNKPTLKKLAEGQARAKFNFHAQSAIELSLNKGELVTLTRRVDDNWFEGRIANRKGIFPVTYVEVLTDIGSEIHTSNLKPVGSPAAHSLTITPVSDYQTSRTNYNSDAYNTLSNSHPQNGIVRANQTIQKTEVLHVDTNSEPVAYRAIYKYRPQNSDELELQEGDTVYVLEKCDDGWFVGTSQRTGCFGTFPGNYVEKL